MKGDPRRLLDGTPLPGRFQPFNGVTFESKLDKLQTPGAHFTDIIERLRPYVEKIAEVADLATTHSTRIWVVEHTERDMIDAFLAPVDVATAAAMHAEVIVSSYYEGDYDED